MFGITNLIGFGSIVGNWKTAAGPSGLDTNATGYAGYTLRQLIDKSVTSNGGGIASRVTFTSSTAADYVIANAYIQYQAASGDAYDFSTTPIQIFFSGLAGATVTAGTSLTSDPVPFVIDASKNIVVSVYASAASAIRTKATVTGWRGFYKNANEAATVDATGYIEGNNAILVSQVDSFY